MAARDHRELSLSSDDDSAAAAAAAGDLRRGPWTVEEDMLLVNYVAAHGEGRWNALARSAGLRRTGKSCRLRWLNYLRPDLRRGNITAQEQLLILELHARWGNRWSKIAQHLPGRTDNEIKNYWRTRVQKHARQLDCDVNSQRFKDLMRYIWMPRLLERINCADDSGGDGGVIDEDALVAAPPPAQQQLVTAAWQVGDDNVAELSCCTTAAVSSSSVSTDSMQQEHKQLAAASTPPPAAAAVASYYGIGINGELESTNGGASYYGIGIDSKCNTASMSSMWDTTAALCQPPQSSSTTTAGGAGTCGTSWSDESLLVPDTAGLSDMLLGFPDLCDTDTMWAAGAGTGADDLWYTHIMGL